MCIYIFAFNPTLQINKYVVGAMHRLLNHSPPALGPYRGTDLLLWDWAK